MNFIKKEVRKIEDIRLLKVDGWSNPRFGFIAGNGIGFEAMWHGCACPTCYGRLNAVMNRMKDSDLKWQVQNISFPEREGVPSAVLLVEPKEMPEQIDNYLSDLLGLRIKEVALSTL